MRYVVIIEDNRILGVLRVNTALDRLGRHRSGATLRDLANRDFTIVREDDIIFDVIQRIWRRRAAWLSWSAVTAYRGRGMSPG